MKAANVQTNEQTNEKSLAHEKIQSLEEEEENKTS